MLPLWWCPFKIKKEKLGGLQFFSTDYLSLVLTPLRIRWTIPLSGEIHKDTPEAWLRESEVAQQVVKFGLFSNIVSVEVIQAM
jgi:hypothetical protein